jgi:hypothetical protein
MTDVQTQDPQTQTKLTIGSDRSFGQPTGESVLHVSGQSPDGQQIVDFAAIEFDPKEADATAKLWRSMKAPPRELEDKITREVLAAYGSQLSGTDARTVSQIVTRAFQQQAATWLGEQPDQPQQANQRIERLAERCERGAGARRSPVGSSQSSGGDGGTESYRPAGQGGQRHRD